MNRLQLPRLSQFLTVRLGDTERYWRTRTSLLRASVAVSQRTFQLRELIFAGRANLSGLRLLTRQILLPSVLAAASVLALHFLDPQWRPLIGDLGFADTQLGDELARPVNASVYAVLLETVAGVTGVFLALYFTAINTVAATVYVAVPHDVRSLIVRDRLGNAYVRTVAYLTALAVFLLVARASGASPYHLALPLIAALSAFAIFAFIRLGQRAFYFADPTVLVDQPAQSFARSLGKARANSWRALDASVQEQCRSRAEEDVHTIVSLLALSAAQAHLRGAPQTRVLQRIGLLLGFYLERKDSLPTRSRWFGERYEHKQWFLTESTEVTMATENETQLQPRVVPDREWVERTLLDAAIECLADDLREERDADATTVLGQLAVPWEAFGWSWMTREGAHWTERITSIVIDELTARPSAQQASPPVVLAAIDTAGYLPIALELGLYKRVTGLHAAALHARWSATDWAQDGAAYAAGLPLRVTETLEEVGESARFERDAGGAVRTPGWYAAELAFNSLAWALYEQLHGCLDFAEAWFLAAADRLTEAGAPDCAGAILARGLEHAWKLARHLPHFEEHAKALLPDSPLIGLTRPEWDWGSLQGRIEQFRRAILRRMAASIPNLLDQGTRADVPDYLGQAVHRSGETCFEALEEGNAELLEAIFRPYFLGVLRTVDRLRPEVAEWSDVSTAFAWMTEPIMDLVDLSGYAIIFAAYYRRPELWDQFKEAWDRYLQGEQRSARLRVLAAACAFHSRMFSISPRATLRTRWEMRLTQLLSELPRQAPTTSFGEGTVEHPSALIRRLTPSFSGLGMTVHATDVFIARYVGRLEGAHDLDFGSVREDLQELEGEEGP